MGSVASDTTDTPGLLGFIIGGNYHGSFIEHRSHPRALGVEIAEFIARLADDEVDVMAKRLLRVQWIKTPTRIPSPSTTLTALLDGTRTTLPNDEHLLQAGEGEWAYFLDFANRLVHIWADQTGCYAAVKFADVTPEYMREFRFTDADAAMHEAAYVVEERVNGWRAEVARGMNGNGHEDGYEGGNEAGNEGVGIEEGIYGPVGEFEGYESDSDGEFGDTENGDEDEDHTEVPSPTQGSALHLVGTPQYSPHISFTHVGRHMSGNGYANGWANNGNASEYPRVPSVPSHGPQPNGNGNGVVDGGNGHADGQWEGRGQTNGYGHASDEWKRTELRRRSTD